MLSINLKATREARALHDAFGQTVRFLN